MAATSDHVICAGPTVAAFHVEISSPLPKQFTLSSQANATI
jgi:hypothetical protein